MKTIVKIGIGLAGLTVVGLLIDRFADKVADKVCTKIALQCDAKNPIDDEHGVLEADEID